MTTNATSKPNIIVIMADHRATWRVGRWNGFLDWPMLTNLRLDPFERMGLPNGANGSLSYYNFFVHKFWRFVYVQQEVEKYAMTFVEFPPMHKGASFNREAIKAQIVKAIQGNHGGGNYPPLMGLLTPSVYEDGK